jgi:hypothetical protein
LGRQRSFGRVLARAIPLLVGIIALLVTHSGLVEGTTGWQTRAYPVHVSPSGRQAVSPGYPAPGGDTYTLPAPPAAPAPPGSAPLPAPIPPPPVTSAPGLAARVLIARQIGVPPDTLTVAVDTAVDYPALGQRHQAVVVVDPRGKGQVYKRFVDLRTGQVLDDPATVERAEADALTALRQDRAPTSRPTTNDRRPAVAGRTPRSSGRSTTVRTS